MDDLTGSNNQDVSRLTANDFGDYEVAGLKWHAVTGHADIKSTKATLSKVETVIVIGLAHEHGAHGGEFDDVGAVDESVDDCIHLITRDHKKFGKEWIVFEVASESETSGAEVSVVVN